MDCRSLCLEDVPYCQGVVRHTGTRSIETETVPLLDSGPDLRTQAKGEPAATDLGDISTGKGRDKR